MRFHDTGIKRLQHPTVGRLDLNFEAGGTELHFPMSTASTNTRTPPTIKTTPKNATSRRIGFCRDRMYATAPDQGRRPMPSRELLLTCLYPFAVRGALPAVATLKPGTDYSGVKLSKPDTFSGVTIVSCRLDSATTLMAKAAPNGTG